MAPPTATVTVNLLRDFLQDDAPGREKSVARWMSITGAVCFVIALALGPQIGWKLAGGLAGLLLLVVGYYGGLQVALSRGWYHPAVAWVNVCIETSIPLLVMLLDFHARGPDYALTAPPMMVWGALICFSALRASRSLSLTAGALAAAEYTLAYALLLHPAQAPDTLLSLTSPFIAVRVFFLLASGAAGALLAHHFLQKAVQALQAVRAADLLSKYILHEKLGEGGMAEVFRATYSPEGGFEKPVAVKRVLPEFAQNADFSELFLTEAKLGSLLTHPNIVQVLDVGKLGGTYVLAMEYVDGTTLRDVIRSRREPLPLAAISYLGAELAFALDYLHKRTDSDGKPLGLVHRDVNPPNVLISRIGEVKLSDFGVAQAAKRVDDEDPTRVVGKPGYTAPEQVKHLRIDHRADLFCMGLVLYEALTGRRALQGTTVEALLAACLEELPDPAITRPDIPTEISDVVGSLLSLDPEMRPPDGRTVRERLLSLQGPMAPYPHGQQALAKAVNEAMARNQPAPDPFAYVLTSGPSAAPIAGQPLEPHEAGTTPSQPGKK
jgi:serine/threonine-protein kinase